MFGDEHRSWSSPFCNFPFPWHLVPLNAEIPSLAPYYRTPSAFTIFLPLMWETKFHTHTKTGKIISSVYFKLCVFWTANGKTGDSGPNARRHSPSSISSWASNISTYFCGSLLHSIFTVKCELETSVKTVKNNWIHNTNKRTSIKTYTSHIIHQDSNMFRFSLDHPQGVHIKQAYIMMNYNP